MRVGIITGEYPPMHGGVGAFTHELALALAAQQHETHILADQRSADAGEPGISVTGSVKNWNNAALGQIQAWARRVKPDVINLQYEAAAFNMAGAVNFLPDVLRPFPVVTTFHDVLPPYLFPKAGPLRPWIMGRLARHSAGVIATNAPDEAALRAAGAFNLRRIPIGSNIPCAPPSGYDAVAWRVGLNIPPGAVVMGYFGFLNGDKGLPSLFEAFQQAIQSGLDAYLLMVGGRTGASDPQAAAFAAQIDALIARLGMADRLRWTGFVASQNVSAHLLACDLLVLPYGDGASLRRGSLMAGLAHGRPIITTTPAQPIPELRDGEEVRFVPAGDVERLAGTMVEVAHSEHLRRKLSANAAEVAKLFRWETIAEQTAALFRHVMK